ncbi:MAG: hypothetical protein R3E77_06950 [Steroidobacteraceae bacterium]
MMPRKRFSIFALVSLLTTAYLAHGQEAPGAEAAPVTEEAPDAAQQSTIKVPEGTEVALAFVDALSSKTNTDGDRFNLRVDGDVRVNGVVAIPSGAIAVGTVTHARKKGYMGKAGELNVILDYVSVGDRRVKLRANKGNEGDAKVGATVALTVLFGPLGLLKRGHDIDIKPGTPITAYVDQSVELPFSP